MSTVLDYQGRRFDVLALRGAQSSGDVQLSQDLFDEESSGEICTGVQKLAQRWVLEFLTIRGTLAFLPDRGTDFVQQVRDGVLRSDPDVVTAFTLASIALRRNLRTEEDVAMPTDELFGNATLDSITLLPGFLSLGVTVNSQAGTSRQVILPISTLPIKLT